MRAVGLAVLTALAVLVMPAAASGQTFQVDRISDINPGAAHADIRGGEVLTIGATIYFWADDGVRGKELWKSNGTAAGTVLVKDIAPGLTSAYPGTALAYMTVMGGKLYFAANDGVRGNELWKSDGTSAGTVIVKDINPGSAGSDPGGASGGSGRIVTVGTRLLFPATTPGLGTELYKSDGSSGGTGLVEDLNGGSSSARPEQLTAVGSTLFFRALTPSSGFELFKSDGSAAGTTLVRDIYPGSFSSSPDWLASAGGTLFFSAFSPANGREPYKSDGSAAGTVELRNVNPGGSSNPEQLTASGSTVFFTAIDGTRGREPWKSAGISASLVRDVNPGSGSSEPYALSPVGGVVYFGASEPATGFELWRTEGTPASTVRLSDIKPGAAGSFPNSVTALGAAVFFTAFHASLGKELYVLRDTGPSMVRDLWPGSGSSSPYALTPITSRFSRNDKLLFAADDGSHGWELWKLVPEMVIGP